MNQIKVCIRRSLFIKTSILIDKQLPNKSELGSKHLCIPKSMIICLLLLIYYIHITIFPIPMDTALSVESSFKLDVRTAVKITTLLIWLTTEAVK